MTAGDSRLKMKSKQTKQNPNVNKQNAEQEKIRSGKFGPTTAAIRKRDLWTPKMRRKKLRKRASPRTAHLMMTMEARSCNVRNAPRGHVRAKREHVS